MLSNRVRLSVFSICNKPLLVFLSAILITNLASGSADAASPRASSKASAAAAHQLINSPTDNYIAGMEFADFWQKTRMPLRVYFHPSSTVPGFEPAFLDGFKTCCDMWSTATGGMVNFTYTNNLAESDIDVRWTADTKTWDIKSDQHELGVCAPTTRMNEGIEHASICLLTTIFQKHVGVKAMQWAALHELGHAIGLGHSGRESDVMKRRVRVDTIAGVNVVEARNSEVRLSDRDVTTIKIIYSAKEKLDVIRRKNLGKDETCRELLNEACRQIRAGDSGQAIVFLREVLTLDPSSNLASQNLMIAYYNCGVELYNEQHYSEAKEVLDRSLELARRVATAQELKEMRVVENRCLVALRNSNQTPQSAPTNSTGFYAGRGSR